MHDRTKIICSFCILLRKKIADCSMCPLAFVWSRKGCSCRQEAGEDVCAQRSRCNALQPSTIDLDGAAVKTPDNNGKAFAPDGLGEVWGEGGGVLDCRAATAAWAMAPLCASPRKCSRHASSSEYSTCSCITHTQLLLVTIQVFYTVVISSAGASSQTATLATLLISSPPVMCSA